MAQLGMVSNSNKWFYFPFNNENCRKKKNNAPTRAINLIEDGDAVRSKVTVTAHSRYELKGQVGRPLPSAMILRMSRA
jgi:hypothetical protein